MNQPVQIDVLPVNGWIMEIDKGDITMTSPHFTKVSGLNKKTGSIEVVDGGSNTVVFFSDGILKHEPVTLTRSRDGSADDGAYAEFFKRQIGGGGKRSGTLVQYRHGVEVLQIRFKGMLFNDYSLSDLDTHGTDKSEQSYVVQVDFWDDVHSPRI